MLRVLFRILSITAITPENRRIRDVATTEIQSQGCDLVMLGSILVDSLVLWYKSIHGGIEAGVERKKNCFDNRRSNRTVLRPR